MKPLRTLMGLALIVCLLAGRASAAAWVQVNAGDKKYFLPQDRYAALEKGSVGAVEALFTTAGGAKKSQAVIKKKAATSFVVVVPNTTEIAVSGVGTVEVPATTQPAKKKAPAKKPAPKKEAPKAKPETAGPFDPIEAVKADKAIPQARREAVVKFYEKLKAENPAEYAKLKTAADVKAMTEKFLNADDKIGKGDLGRTYASMFPSAAPVSGGAVADPVTGGAVDKKPVKPETVQGAVVGGSEVKPGESQTVDLVSDIAKKIAANPAAAQASLTDRFYKFLTEDDKYVSDTVRGKADVMKNLKTYTEAWVKTQIAEGKTGDLATLYIVMGSGTPAPDWAVKDPLIGKALADLLQAAARLPKLKTAMANDGWTQKGIGGKKGYVAAGKQDEIIAFFSNAPKDAKTGGATFWAIAVLNENRLDSDLKTSIIAREEKPQVPGRTGGGGEIIKDPVKAFGFDALYNRGGVSDIVFADGDPVSRKISMKLYTTREPDGTLSTKIGIFDITNKSDIFGQRFDIPNGPGSYSFALDDRKPGFPKYTLSFTPGEEGMKVTFGRDGDGGNKLQSTVSGLYRARAQQAVDEGVPVTVGGQKYLAIGQGSGKAGLVFFPADAGERINDGESVDAALYANTAGKSGGRDVNLPGKRHLGTVDGKDYHMVFNDKLKYWEVKEGKGGDLEEPKPATTTAGGTTTQGGTTNPGGTTTPDGTQVTTPDAGAEAEAALLKDGEWEINTEVSKGLADQYKSKVRVYSWTNRNNKEPGKQIGRPISERHWVFDANLPKGRAYLPFFNPTKDDMLRKTGEVRGIGKYLAVTTDQFTGYLDVSKLNPNPETKHYLYDINTKCMVWEPENKEGGRSFCVKDLVLLEDALIRVGAPPEMRKTILDNARTLKLAEEANLMTIESKWDKEAKPKPTWGPVVAIVTGKGGATLWPKLVPFGQVAEADGDTKNPTGGQTNAFNTVAGPDAEFPKEPQTVDNQGVKGTAYFVKTSADGMVALYGDDKELAKSTSWYVMAKVKLDGDKVARTGFVQVVLAADKFPGPDKVGMKGPVLPKHPDAQGQRDVISTGGLRKLTKGDAGVIYAVENKNVTTPDTGTTANKYINCMGPVLWWGLDEAKAKKVCDDNKFD